MEIEVSESQGLIYGDGKLIAYRRPAPQRGARPVWVAASRTEGDERVKVTAAIRRCGPSASGVAIANWIREELSK